jgi:hypothetical protein
MSVFDCNYKHAFEPPKVDSGVFASVLRQFDKGEAAFVGGKLAPRQYAATEAPKNMETLKGKLPNAQEMSAMNAALLHSIYPAEKPDAAAAKGREHADAMITRAIEGPKQATPHFSLNVAHDQKHTHG